MNYDGSQPLVSDDQMTTILHYGYVLGALVLIHAAICLIRGNRVRNGIWTALSLFFLFIPLGNLVWAIIYIALRGFGWFTNYISAPPSACGVPGCHNGWITRGDHRVRCTAPYHHGNRPG